MTCSDKKKIIFVALVLIAIATIAEWCVAKQLGVNRNALDDGLDILVSILQMVGVLAFAVSIKVDNHLFSKILLGAGFVSIIGKTLIVATHSTAIVPWVDAVALAVVGICVVWGNKTTMHIAAIPLGCLIVLHMFEINVEAINNEIYGIVHFDLVKNFIYDIILLYVIFKCGEQQYRISAGTIALASMTIGYMVIGSRIIYTSFHGGNDALINSLMLALYILGMIMYTFGQAGRNTALRWCTGAGVFLNIASVMLFICSYQIARIPNFRYIELLLMIMVAYGHIRKRESKALGIILLLVCEVLFRTVAVCGATVTVLPIMLMPIAIMEAQVAAIMSFEGQQIQ